MNLLLDILRPPELHNAEEDRIARLLHIVLLVLITITAVSYIILISLNKDTTTPNFVISLLILEIILLIAMRFIYIRLVAGLLVFVLLIFVASIDIFVFGGLSTPISASYIILMMMAGLFLGAKAAFAYALLALAIITSTILLKQAGWITASNINLSIESRGLIFGSNLFISALLLYLTIHQMTKALQVAYSKEEALSETFRQLKQEIIERQESQEALTSSQQAYRDLLDNLPVGVYRTTADGRFLEANRALINMFGAKSKDELFTHSVSELYRHDVPRDELIDTFRQFDDYYQQELPLRTIKGKPFWGRETAIKKRASTGLVYFEGILSDITSQKNAEQSRRESEARSKAILESIEDGYYEIDRHGRFILVNDAFERITGYSKEQLLGNVYDQHVSEELSADLYKHFHQVFLTGQAVQEVYVPLIAPSGQSKVLAASISLVYNDDKQPIGFRGIIRDVTTQRKAASEREELLASEQEQRLLSETLTGVTLALTSKTDLNEVLDEILHQVKRLVPYTTANIMLLDNDTLRIARWSGHELLQKEAFLSNLVQSLTNLPLDAEAVKSQQPIVTPDTQQDNSWLHLDQTAWIRSHLVLPLRLQDRVVGLLRMNSEHPNQFSQKDAQRLLPLGNAAAIALENARLLETTNRRAAELDAIRRANLSLTSSLELPDVLAAILDSTLELLQEIQDAFVFLYENGRLINSTVKWRNQPHNQQVIEPRAGGTTYQVAQTGNSIIVTDMQNHPLFDDAPSQWQGALASLPLKIGQTVMGVMNVHHAQPHDWRGSEIIILELLADQAAIAIENARLYQNAQQELIDRKRAESELAIRVKELMIANDELQILAYAFAHDFREPLRGINRLSEMLEESLEEALDEETAELMRLLRLRVFRLDSIILGADAYLSVRQNRLPDLEWVDVHQLLTDIIGSLTTSPPFQFEVLPDMPTLWTERAPLQQVFLNLINNAIFHHNNEAGHIKIGITEQENHCQFFVTDDGPGIHPDYHEKIFDIFKTLTPKDKKESSGVGLALVRKILQRRDCQVWVKSAEGQGSTFYFTWPKHKLKQSDDTIAIS